MRLRVLALLALVSGCAAKQPPPVVVWPDPPEVARIRFEKAYMSEDDLEPSFWTRVGRTLTGAASGVRIVQPTGVAVSKGDTHLVVASSAFSALVYIDLVELRMRPCEIRGVAPTRPFAVAMDGEDNIYVTDQASQSVVVLDPTCTTILRRFGDRTLTRPTGIAVDRKRQLVYVLDGANRNSDRHDLEVFREDGTHVRTIGRRGSGEGEFFFPYGVAVSSDGSVAVSDSLNFRVQLFGPDGSFKAAFGKAGTGYGMFGRLKGVAFDAFDNLHVADGEFALVQIFNARNEPLMLYGGRAPYLEYMEMPTAIAIGSRNDIYVADFTIGAIKKYRMINTSKEDANLPLEPPKPAAGEQGAAPSPSPGGVRP